MSRTRFRVNPHSIAASLAKWLSVRLRTKWFWVQVQLQSHNVFTKEINKIALSSIMIKKCNQLIR